MCLRKQKKKEKHKHETSQIKESIAIHRLFTERPPFKEYIHSKPLKQLYYDSMKVPYGANKEIIKTDAQIALMWNTWKNSIYFRRKEKLFQKHKKFVSIYGTK